MNPVANLAAALVKAQGTAQAVAKSSVNQFHRYKYASAEALIEEGREALTAAGLALMTTRWEVIPAQETPTVTLAPNEKAPAVASSRVRVQYILLHTSGESIEASAETSVIPEKGRPQDKAEATALTYNLGYFIRGLLLLPREDEHAVDARDDRDRGAPAHRPGPAAAAPRAPAPRASDGPELNTLDDFMKAIAAAKDFADLQAIAARATKAALEPAQVSALRAAWGARRDALAAPAKEVA